MIEQNGELIPGRFGRKGNLERFLPSIGDPVSTVRMAILQPDSSIRGRGTMEANETRV